MKHDFIVRSFTMSCSSRINLTANEDDNKININLSVESPSTEMEKVKRRGKAKDRGYVISYDTYEEAHHYITNYDGYMGAEWKQLKNEVSKTGATFWFKCTINPDIQVYQSKYTTCNKENVMFALVWLLIITKT